MNTIRDLPNKAWYVRSIAFGNAFFDSCPSGVARMPDMSEVRGVDAWNRIKWEALDKRISARGVAPRRPFRKEADMYQLHMIRDAFKVRDMLSRRIRHYQLETKEARERFGHLLSSYSED